MQALKANEFEVLSDTDLRAILNKFVEFRHSGSHIKPPVKGIIECYELCDSILSGDEDLEERRADLEDLCFTEYWEEKLSAAMDDGTTSEFFDELMIECANRLMEQPEYQMFKDELRKKLKK